jgi:N-acetylmuramoyl-L-alanine amidase
MTRTDRPAFRRFGTVRPLVLVTIAAVLVVGVVGLGWRLAFPSRSTGSNGLSGGQPLDPKKFAAGACVAFGPTNGDRNETVFLDAGHGGIDPGGVGSTEAGKTIYEADETLPVELDAMAILRAKGFRVVVSRTGDSTVLRLAPRDVSGGVLTLQGAHDDVAARDECANDADASVLVGIYFDSSDFSQDAGSLTAYDVDRPFSAENLRLANLLQHDVLAGMNARGWNIPDDGVLPDTDLGSYVGNPAAAGIAGEAAAYDHLMLIGPAMAGFFSTPSKMPGAVTEPLYVSDPFEGSIARSASGQMVIAQEISNAIEQFLRPGPDRPDTPTRPREAALGTPGTPSRCSDDLPAGFTDNAQGAFKDLLGSRSTMVPCLSPPRPSRAPRTRK